MWVDRGGVFNCTKNSAMSIESGSFTDVLCDVVQRVACLCGYGVGWGAVREGRRLS